MDKLSNLHTDLVDHYLNLVDHNETTESNLRNAWQDATDADRTAQSFPDWLEEYAAQISAAWVVTAVFVRFLEDNDLVRTNYIAGPTPDARDTADDTLRWFRNEHPTASETDYLLWVFNQLADMEAGGVFTERRNPLYRWELPADAGRQLLQTLRETDPDTGDIELDFTADPRDTRFLGDLYEALAKSAGLKDKYGLVQTPEFVCDLILEYTLDEAVDELGADQVDMIDPACGSGHFLLDSFWRMLEALEAERPDWSQSRLVTEALDTIHGVDLNSFAVSIARFRLLAAGLQALSTNGRPVRLDNAPELPLNVGAGDALIHGEFHPRFETDCTDAQAQKPLDAFRWDDRFSPEDADLVAGDPNDPEGSVGLLTRQYDVVVGNPPYVTAKDDAQNDAYREFYESCHYKYSLVCPFFERFFDLATGPGFEEETDLNGTLPTADDSHPGWVGMIVGDNFMKRRFGQKLIESIVPNCDLKYLLDTSGAYLPGHGTPTVTLMGRNRQPTTDTVRSAMGIRGEPETPDNPARGKVWSSIVDHLDEEFFENDFITIDDLPRKLFHEHPWTLEGGGALSLKSQIETTKNEKTLDHIADVGVAGMSNADSVLMGFEETWHRRNVQDNWIRELVNGEAVRNWSVNVEDEAIFPYDSNARLLTPAGPIREYLWPFKSFMWNRAVFGGGNYKSEGRPWWEWHQVSHARYDTRFTITFAFTATHNHYVLDRGGKVFKQTAPVIKLPTEADEDDHLELLGPLNSSVGNFWARQVFQNRGGGGSSIKLATDRFANYLERDGTKTKKFPIANSLDVLLPRKLDAFGQELADHRPGVVAHTDIPTPERLDKAKKAREDTLRRMVPLQEELDWRMYQTYGLTGEVPLAEDYHPDASDREAAYEDLPNMAFGERPFEIQLARDIEADEVDTSWFERHDADPITDIPTAGLVGTAS